MTDVTIENVLTDNLYNDLGFIANNKLMLLIEAQSTWTMNILVRVLLYLAQSYHEYFQRTSQNYYKNRKVKMPKPELYVIFTGNKGRKPNKISLSKEFFEGIDGIWWAMVIAEFVVVIFSIICLSAADKNGFRGMNS